MSPEAQQALTVSISEAKKQLSKLADLAASGTDVVITRKGKPVCKLTALDKPKRKIRFGILEGRGWIADDFDDPLPEDLQAAFEGHDEDL